MSNPLKDRFKDLFQTSSSGAAYSKNGVFNPPSPEDQEDPDAQQAETKKPDDEETAAEKHAKNVKKYSKDAPHIKAGMAFWDAKMTSYNEKNGTLTVNPIKDKKSFALQIDEGKVAVENFDKLTPEEKIKAAKEIILFIGADQLNLYGTRDYRDYMHAAAKELQLGTVINEVEGPKPQKHELPKATKTKNGKSRGALKIIQSHASSAMKEVDNFMKSPVGASKKGPAPGQ
jgi:hypothetical protein